MRVEALVSWYIISFTPFSCAYLLSPSRSKSGYGVTKSKTASFSLPNQSSNPVSHPSTRTSSNPCSAAKSMWRMTFVVFAACIDGSGMYAQFFAPVIIVHHTPMYFTGCIQLVSSMAHGSLRFSVMREARISAPFPPTIRVRHGDLHGVCIHPFAPVASGVREDSNDVPSTLRCIVA